MSPPEGKAPALWRFYLPAVLLLAAVLRLSNLDLVSITNDEGSHVLIATYILAEPIHEWPLAGLPSVGIRNSALFIYLMALANTVWFHPLSGAVLVGTFNVLAVLLTWRLTRQHFGLVPARIATLLYACAPWSVIFARNMWPPSCLAVACLWFLNLGLTWQSSGGARRLFLLCLLSFVIPQIHFSGCVAPLWLLCVIGMGRRHWRWTTAMTGSVCGLATWTPWLLFQSFTDWHDLQTAGSVTEGAANAGQTLFLSIKYLQQQLHSGGFDHWFAVGPAELPEYFPAATRALGSIVAAIMTGSLVGSVVLVLRSASRSVSQAALLLLLWCVLPLIGLLAVRPVVHPHYLLVAAPVPLILVAVFLSWCPLRLPRYGTTVLALLLATICVSHLLFLRGWFHYLNDDRPDGHGHFQLTWRQRVDVAKSILADSSGASVDLVGPYAGRNSAYNLAYNHQRIVTGAFAEPFDHSTRYWAQMQPVDVADATFRAAEERRINDTLTIYAGLPGGWRITREWRVGSSQIFRLERR